MVAGAGLGARALRWLPGHQAPAEALVKVDATGEGRPISRRIYGVAAADGETLRRLGATVNRWGGNPSSRYNWVNGHAWNAARDYEFRNGNYGITTGSAADQFVEQTIAAGAEPLITVPTLGWVAKDDDDRVHSTGVPSHGGPAATPQGAVAGYDPARNRSRTSVRSLPRPPDGASDRRPSAEPVYQSEWVRHLEDSYRGAVGLYAMDNEPDLWSSTHTDVHPARMGYRDMADMFQEYTTAVKGVSPRALILGPELSGWTALKYSDLDRGDDNFHTHADRRAHGNVPFLPWWLGEVARRDRQAGLRSLDVLAVHFYPQGEGVFSEKADPDTRALRVRSTRALWDPVYKDESWISDAVRLIPRLREWIRQAYPGTRLAITEYNWGGERDLSGAVALAEVLGIFGREGVDLAAYWAYPGVDTYAGAAFRLYRNPDGNGTAFGDRSLATTTTSSTLGAYAARTSSGGQVDLVLANREDSPVRVRVAVEGFRPAGREEFRVSRSMGSIDHIMAHAEPGAPIDLAPYSVVRLRLMA